MIHEREYRLPLAYDPCVSLLAMISVLTMVKPKTHKKTPFPYDPYDPLLTMLPRITLIQTQKKK
jgi:hypothetical protein